MPQAKITLSQSQIEFINRHEALGFPDRSALVREALNQMQARLAQERLAESARLYAEVYTEEEELQDLTEAALEDWPQ
jgi:Arc/MetJ-type ribon-helix-helix transcriptional regulator